MTHVKHCITAVNCRAHVLPMSYTSCLMKLLCTFAERHLGAIKALLYSTFLQASEWTGSQRYISTQEAISWHGHVNSNYYRNKTST